MGSCDPRTLKSRKSGSKSIFRRFFNTERLCRITILNPSIFPSYVGGRIIVLANSSQRHHLPSTRCVLGLHNFTSTLQLNLRQARNMNHSDLSLEKGEHPCSEMIQHCTQFSCAHTLQEVTCAQCLEILNKHGYDQLPVVDNDNQVTGMVVNFLQKKEACKDQYIVTFAE